MSANRIALLRGINLGATNRVSMPELRELIEGLGHKDVADPGAERQRRVHRARQAGHAGEAAEQRRSRRSSA